jgi:putative copper export protein
MDNFLLLLLKSFLVFTALAVDATNRLLLRQSQPLSAPRFPKLMRAEPILMLAILAVSGWLANSPPAVGS